MRQLFRKIIVIVCSVVMIITMCLSYGFAESEENEIVPELGDVITEALVSAQANQMIYLGDGKGYDFTDLMIVDNGITYLPVRLAFTGEMRETEVEGIRTAVTEFMQEPSIAISVQYVKDGMTIRKKVNLNWFDSERIRTLEANDGITRTYFDMGKTETEPNGKMIFYEAGEQIGTNEDGSGVFKVVPGNGPNGSWYEAFEAPPILRQINSDGESRVYIPVNNFNDMIQYLVGDTNYHVQKP